MDFVARAGGLMDRAHHVAGLLLIALISVCVLCFYFMEKNAELQAQVDDWSSRLPVYVVPGSLAGIYAPTDDQMLLKSFSTLMTQSLNTFTYESLAAQYNEVKKFFSAKMLVFADNHYLRVIKQSNIDGRSSLFVPDERSYTVRDVRDANGRPTGNKIVEMIGQLNRILAGNVVEAVPLKVTMEVQKVTVSTTNPFGFVLTSYNEKELDKDQFEKLGLGKGGWVKTQAQEDAPKELRNY